MMGEVKPEGTRNFILRPLRSPVPFSVMPRIVFATIGEATEYLNGQGDEAGELFEYSAADGGFYALTEDGGKVLAFAVIPMYVSMFVTGGK